MAIIVHNGSRLEQKLTKWSKKITKRTVKSTTIIVRENSKSTQEIITQIEQFAIFCNFLCLKSLMTIRHHVVLSRLIRILYGCAHLSLKKPEEVSVDSVEITSGVQCFNYKIF